MDQKKAKELMERLGFQFNMQWQLKDGQEEMFAALVQLIAGAVFDWADAKDDVGEEVDGKIQTKEDILEQLTEWAEEWLVG